MRVRRPPFAPLRVLDIEATEPLVLEPMSEWSGVHALVRAAGTPVGTVTVRNVGRVGTTRALEQAIHAQLGQRIARQIERDRVLRPRSEPAARPTVSVIVCTRDRPRDLAACLEALARSTWPDLEVIVVDSASHGDATRRVAARHPRFRYVRENEPGLDIARNRGIREASSEILAFTDDDVVVDPDWVDRVAAVFMHNPEAMAVTGLVMPLELETESQWLFEQYGGFGRGFQRRWHLVQQDRREHAATHHGNPGIFGTGANMAFRRRVFDRVGLFDPALDVGTLTRGGGDLDMFFRVLKAGYVLTYEPRAVVWHRHRRTMEELQAQLHGWGTGMYSFVTRSWLEFPEERAALAWQIAMLGGSWFLRRYLSSFVRPRFPRSLILTELRGALGAPRLYTDARRAAVDSAMMRGERLADGPEVMWRARREPRLVSRTIRTDSGLEPLADVAHASRVRITALEGARAIATVLLSNQWRPVGAMRLADALAAHVVP